MKATTDRVLHSAEMQGPRGLASRGLRPAAELAANRPHGDRLRYVGGCRCDACRKANSAYESARQRARKAGDWNGIVSAEAARAHMVKLSRKGVGRRAIAAATDIADTLLSAIRTGRKTRIRARTERLILGVTPAVASDHAIQSAARVHRLIERLLEEEYSEEYLAKRLGYATGRLQFGDRITVKNAARVERLYRELMS
ncbi:MAG: hypothetical protein AB1832_00975 [Pseudomonadota bacterium]